MLSSRSPPKRVAWKRRSYAIAVWIGGQVHMPKLIAKQGAVEFPPTWHPFPSLHACHSISPPLSPPSLFSGPPVTCQETVETRSDV
ncbi:hypothetical protein NL676_019209 [Syzygium grande]|nr:hypothetical protein NL676_019209 [Syzygium grande]